MKKIMLAATAFAALMSSAHAGAFEAYSHTVDYCRFVGKIGVEAYHDSKDEFAQTHDPNAWVQQHGADTGNENADEAFSYAVHYAMEKAASAQDAFDTAYSHCMDALN